MGMERYEVLLGEEKYSINYLDAVTAYLKLAKYGGNFSKMVSSLLQGNTEIFNNILDQLVEPKELLEMFNVFVKDRNVKCDGVLITDIGTHFQGRPTDMFKLLFKAIEANDKDFFTSLPTLIESLVGKITEKLQTSLLPNQGEENSEKNQEAMDALMNLAQKAKETLSSNR